MAASASDLLLLVGTPGSATTLSANYTTGATSITVASTANWPTTTGVVFAMDEAETVNGQEVQVAGTYREFIGTVATATSIINVDCVYGTDRDFDAGATTRVYVPVSAERENRIVEWGTTEHEQDGTHGVELITSRTEDTDPDPDADFLLTYDTSASALKKVKPSNLGGSTGWTANSLPTVSSVTNNGNRSYDIVFGSTVASLLSPGMRLRTTRTVTAPTYMGGLFNGSSHYFTKVTPTSTLSTVANNFTIMGWVEPTSYVDSTVAGRYDSSANNGFELRTFSNGQIGVQVTNGGSANYRYVQTYQSLPLNKKTHVAASWTSGTVVIYLDGVSVPVATATTSGTAPTTAGTGGDFSIGRRGANANLYFPGYLSNVAVFDAVLTASTIRSYMSQVLSGSETNCIGAWSLNNTGVNQQAAGTNDLTATGGVSYTSGRSPYGTDSNGVSTGTTDYALVMKVSTTTATVQVPEGCTIPTSGGVSAVAYSTATSPFGFTLDKGRWEVESLYLATATQSSPVVSTWYNIGSSQLLIPVGQYIVTYNFTVNASRTSSAISAYATLSTGSSTESDKKMTTRLYQDATGASAINGAGSLTRTRSYSVASATTYYQNALVDLTLHGTLQYLNAQSSGLITAIPAGI